MNPRTLTLLALLSATTALGGCTAISNLAVSLTSASPTQAKSVAEAEQVTTLAEQALDLYVQNGNPSQPVLAELKILVPALHNALKQVEAANTAGNSASAAAALAAFNQALAALNSYKTNQGVS